MFPLHAPSGSTSKGVGVELDDTSEPCSKPVMSHSSICDAASTTSWIARSEISKRHLLHPPCCQCDLGCVPRVRRARARVRVASRSNRSGPGIVRHRVVIRLVGRSDSLRKTNAIFDRARGSGICIPPKSLCVRFSETRPVPVIRSSNVQYSVVPKPGAPAPVGAASCRTPQCD